MEVWGRGGDARNGRFEGDTTETPLPVSFLGMSLYLWEVRLSGLGGPFREALCQHPTPVSIRIDAASSSAQTNGVIFERREGTAFLTRRGMTAEDRARESLEGLGGLLGVGRRRLAMLWGEAWWGRRLSASVLWGCGGQRGRSSKAKETLFVPKESKIAVQGRVASRAKRAGCFCVGVPVGHLFHFFECHRQISCPRVGGPLWWAFRFGA